MAMTKQIKAVVLLSGGQDSAACLSLAVATHGFESILALSIFYGQRHATEIDAAAAVAEVYNVDHVIIELPAFGALTAPVSDLTKPAGDIAAEGGIADAQMPQGLPTSFVPGRNALFLTLAASVAVSRGASEVWTGVCQTDFSGYPDCRLIFVEAMQQALTLAMPSSNPIRIVTPLMHLTKAETVRLAHRLPFGWKALAQTITCYYGIKAGCGRCPACKLREQGFEQAGLTDPAKE